MDARQSWWREMKETVISCLLHSAHCRAMFQTSTIQLLKGFEAGNHSYAFQQKHHMIDFYHKMGPEPMV